MHSVEKIGFLVKKEWGTLDKLLEIQENAFPAQLVPAEFPRKLPGGARLDPLNQPGTAGQRAAELSFRDDSDAVLFSYKTMGRTSCPCKK